MRIKCVRFFRYRLPLKVPLDVGRVRMTHREGFLVRCEAESGEVGWGEAAPLPGYTRETLDDAERALRAASVYMKSRTLEADDILATDIWEYIKETTPSVRFGVESAFMQLFAGSGRGFRELLSNSFADRVQVNGLFQAPVVPSGEEMTVWHTRGMRTVKCKVGRRSLESEREWILQLANTLPPGMRIRLDANRAWSLDEAVRFFSGVPQPVIEYVEEPLADVGELPLLASETGIPIALDETVQERGEAIFHLGFKPAAVVLKPGALPGIGAVMSWQRLAQGSDLTLVVSSLFESGVGMIALAQVAACLCGAQVCCGLDTSRIFAEDTLNPRWSPEGWSWDLRQVDETRYSVRQEILEELTG